MAVIFQSFTPGIADIRACVIDNRGGADLLVYAVSDLGAAHGDGLWYITKNQGMASSKIYFGSRGSAKLLVHFVSDRSQARWLRSHPLQGKL